MNVKLSEIAVVSQFEIRDTAYHFLPARQPAHVPPDDVAAVEERERSELARLKAKYGG